jgi:hypothetical protein
VFDLLGALFLSVVGGFRSRAALVAENLALRQQLAVLRRRHARPRLLPIERAFWPLLSRAWSDWTSALAIVKPATVIAWHRLEFVRFWRSRSRPRGRPKTAAELVLLVARMARENPRWSCRRIASELAKLGDRIDKNTVAKYMPKQGRPPSQTWGTFLRNHLRGSIAIDFFTVPTITFSVLHVFVVLSLERRRILDVNVTSSPSAEWTAQQVVEALGLDTTTKLLIRDRDAIYGDAFVRRVRNLGLKELRTRAAQKFRSLCRSSARTRRPRAGRTPASAARFQSRSHPATRRTRN